MRRIIHSLFIITLVAVAAVPIANAEESENPISSDLTREPAATPRTTPPGEVSSGKPVAPRERPFKVYRLEALGGVGTRAYGSSIGSEWTHQPSESPLVRIEVGRELWNYDRQFAFTLAVDVDYLKSVQRLSSSTASSSVVSEHGFLGGTAGLAWQPPALRGFGFRASLGLIYSLFGHTELRSPGFTVDLKSPDESLFAFVSKSQSAFSIFYEMNERAKLVVESRLIGGNASHVIAGAGYEL